MAKVVGNTVVIGIDTGYGLVKTVNKVFPSGLKSNKGEKPAFTDGVIKYKGEYFTVGGERTAVKIDKTEDDVTYILTLAAIAEELKLLGKTEANIFLGVGLPLTRCSGDNRTKFQNYYLREKNITFEYEDKIYNITLEGVKVDAQCFAGVLPDLLRGTLKSPSVIIDVGSWTIDAIPVDSEMDKSGQFRPRPVAAKAVTINSGLINCINRCNDLINMKYGVSVSESQIQAVMRNIRSGLPEDIEDMIKTEITAYCSEIANQILERKLNIQMLPCRIVGGGAIVVKNYGSQFFNDVEFDTNINFNAEGYEIHIQKELERKSA